MAIELGIDPYGAPDPKMGSFRSAETRRTNGHSNSVRNMDRSMDRIVVVPIGVKRFVPGYAQGYDPYESPDPKMGGYTFDARATRRTMV